MPTEDPKTCEHGVGIGEGSPSCEPCTNAWIRKSHRATIAREVMAALASLPSRPGSEDPLRIPAFYAAVIAVQWADALLDELEKPKN